ncbi:helix-turn-helix transcriptional regulator [Wenyingzhuangia sp. chi5]|uniref:Helix-turn-helix transcriptional regulator n=1 Tax=Wenyingzhuangia gilva TaxID=3057677 RepID=A0ABT8VUR8_9FLAO|nr:helix-turn-helix transcriptional regulator [Wenyingzhuangia sp. chi5]MDO3695687.1 helix-turn-helix transcriptional regulator [Wenyingzhuangia sp. chi5]
MLNQEDFINRLHKLLEHYHLSAATFADEINVQRSSISHLLSGRNKPSLEFILKIVDTYKEVSLDWLLYGKEQFPGKESKSTKVEEGLFAIPEENTTPKPAVNSEQKKTTTPSDIERIVVFYKNGTFKEYSEISS